MKKLNLPEEKSFVGPALLWKRIAAFFIDMAVINMVIFFPFRGLFQKMLPKDYSFSQALNAFGSSDYYGLLNSVSIAMSILIILYFLMLEKKIGQSIGKRIMKIYVASDTGEFKTWQALTRNIVFIPVFPFFLLWILDPLFMFFTKTNQRLTEILSRTRVLEIYSLEHGQ